MRRLFVIERAKLVGEAIAKRLSGVAETRVLVVHDMIDMDVLPKEAPDAVLVNTRLAAMNKNGRKIMHAYRDRATGEPFRRIILRRDASDDLTGPETRPAYQALIAEGLAEVHFDAQSKPAVVAEALEKMFAPKVEKKEAAPPKAKSPERELKERIERGLGLVAPPPAEGTTEEVLAQRHPFRMEHHPEEQEVRLFGFAAEKDVPGIVKMLNTFARELPEVAGRTRLFYLNFEQVVSLSVGCARLLAGILETQVKLRAGEVAVEEVAPAVRKGLKLLRFDPVKFREHNPDLGPKGSQFLFLLREFVVRNKANVDVIAKARSAQSDLYRER
jgi:hypothetical protein